MVRRNRRSSLLLAFGVVVAATLPTGASSATGVGSLHVHAALKVGWQVVTCPAGTPSTGLCYSVRGSGVVPGLGQTTEQYTYVVDDASTTGTTSTHFVATLAVPGKGTIVASAQAYALPPCDCGASDIHFPFTITQGTGSYVGAEGSGTVEVNQYATAIGKGAGTDSWSGTLNVPGYVFDTARPVIRGAVPKTVKAPKGEKRIRVRYKVSARDPDEGPIPVTCKPRSGKRFKLGRTLVRCASTDTNGNTAKAKFRITVKRR